MNTNQIFQMNRFGRYVKSTFLSNWKQTALIWAAIGSTVFLFSLAMMSNTHSHWNTNSWMQLFVILYFAGGVVYSGIAFPALRSKKKAMGWLTLPVSTFERFTVELFEKVIAFVVCYPIVFYLFSSIAVVIRNSSQMTKTVTVNGIQTFPFETISFAELFTKAPEGQMPLIFWMSIFLFILAFAGAATFGRNALIKTILFVGLLVGAIVGYFYILFEVLKQNHSWIKIHAEMIEKPDGLRIIDSAIILFSLTALAFAYFKLKEKEVR